jgi:hypothetical protein
MKEVYKNKNMNNTTNTNKTKTGRKNNTKMSINWLSSHFTIKELLANNPSFREITLRVRLKKAIDAGEVIELGTLHQEKGRPSLVLANAPVSKATIESAKKLGVMFSESFNVKVADVKAPAPKVDVTTPTAVAV